MAKKIVDENGNTYVQKKPFYKRVWFWILIILVVIIGFGTLGGGEEAKKVSSVNNSKSTSSSKDISKQTFKVGDTIKYNGITLKVNNVTFNNGNDISKPDQGKNYVLVNVTITNKDKDKASYNALDFKLDDKGNQTDMIEFAVDENGNSLAKDELKSGDLAKGATVTGTLSGQAIKDDKLKLIYTGSLFSNDEKITIDLN